MRVLVRHPIQRSQPTLITGAIHNSAVSLASSLSKPIKAMADFPLRGLQQFQQSRGFQDASGIGLPLRPRIRRGWLLPLPSTCSPVVGCQIPLCHHPKSRYGLTVSDGISLLPTHETSAFCLVPLDYSKSLCGTNGIESMRTITDRQPVDTDAVTWGDHEARERRGPGCPAIPRCATGRSHSFGRCRSSDWTGMVGRSRRCLQDGAEPR